MKLRLNTVDDKPIYILQLGGRNDQERYLLSRAGYERKTHVQETYTLVIAPHKKKFEYDPFKWQDKAIRKLHFSAEKDKDNLSQYTMQEIKTFELRDVGTFIPIICIRMLDDINTLICDLTHNSVGVTPEGWGPSQTFSIAHRYINVNWGILENGQVIDARYILGEQEHHAVSESEYDQAKV